MNTPNIEKLLVRYYNDELPFDQTARVAAWIAASEENRKIAEQVYYICFAAETPEALLRPVDTLFSDYPGLSLSPAAEKKVRNGAQISAPGALSSGTYRLYGTDGTFLALSRCDGQKLVTIKSFFNTQVQVN